jgi:hypothetical protein
MAVSIMSQELIMGVLAVKVHESSGAELLT